MIKTRRLNTLQSTTRIPMLNPNLSRTLTCTRTVTATLLYIFLLFLSSPFLSLVSAVVLVGAREPPMMSPSDMSVTSPPRGQGSSRSTRYPLPNHSLSLPLSLSLSYSLSLFPALPPSLYLSTSTPTTPTTERTSPVKTCPSLSQVPSTGLHQTDPLPFIRIKITRHLALCVGVADFSLYKYNR